MEQVVKAKGLTKTYGKNRGIKDVDLTVREGEVFGFLGPNGAGKTTMIRTLLGFMHPTGGSAEIFGHDISRDSVAVRSMVGNLPGEFALEDRMNGEKLLKLFARLRGVESLDYAYELADRINADLTRPMRRLSRGNKQKIGLIQAMFHRPPLLILDEPTGGLDPLVQEEFLRIIGEVKAEGRTVFFSSHTLNEVERVCDRVGIIREGELVRVETTDTLINKSFRHVMLDFANAIGGEEARRFEELEGIEKFEQDGERLSFELHGNLDSVIKLAARHEVLDMIYERPSLEEIFLAYYGGEDTSDEGEASSVPGAGKAPASGPSGAPGNGDTGNARNGNGSPAGTGAEATSRYTGSEASHNGSRTSSPASSAGIAMQQAIEAIVEQTVERTVERMTAGDGAERPVERAAQKGDRQ
ncbi:ABC transporter ATP-binding protein [Rubrobacter aplysinae]|uniref:ABC transporter ATP-binding protein n=1 Tax=Rubrobacter aplysinae TaxID=909625 RepID=UPI000A01BED4|nr:ABC transporter ATP-binding protein [Rubrobacter aplysinae]